MFGTFGSTKFSKISLITLVLQENRRTMVEASSLISHYKKRKKKTQQNGAANAMGIGNIMQSFLFFILFFC